jgi:PhnB protein
MAVNPVPAGYRTVNAYLIVDDAARAIDFYARAFGATELYRLPMKDAQGVEKIGHAEIRIGDTSLMLSDEWPAMDCLGPNSRGGATASFVIYGADADAAWQRAVDAGARGERPVREEFWGDRMGTVIDPFGHKWTLGTHVRDVSPEEMARAMRDWCPEATAPT